MPVRTGECNSCGKCCETVNMTVVRDVTLRQHGTLQELKKYLDYRGIRLAGEDVENNSLFYTLDLPCSQLGADRKTCQVHNTPEMPLLCLRYPLAPGGVEECSYRFQSAAAAFFDRLGVRKE